MKKNKHTRSQIAGRWLLGWTLFIGIGAVAGASGMLLDPSGKAMGKCIAYPLTPTKKALIYAGLKGSKA